MRTLTASHRKRILNNVVHNCLQGDAAWHEVNIALHAAVDHMKYKRQGIVPFPIPAINRALALAQMLKDIHTYPEIWIVDKFRDCIVLTNDYAYIGIGYRFYDELMVRYNAFNLGALKKYRDFILQTLNNAKTYNEKQRRFAQEQVQQAPEDPRARHAEELREAVLSFSDMQAVSANFETLFRPNGNTGSGIMF